MSLNWRIIALTVLAVAGAAALATGMQSLYVDRIYAGLAQSRFNYTLQGLKNAVEVNVGLGFPLAELRLAQDLIEREKAADDQILAIEVLDDAGRTLFSTDRGTVGEEPPPAWATAIADARGRGWRARERDVAAEAAPLVNDFEITIGYVVLSYAPGYYDKRAEAVALSLAAAAAAAALVCGALAAGIASLLLRRRLQPQIQALDLLTHPQRQPPPSVSDHPLADAVLAAQASLRAVDADLEAALADLNRLEDEL